MWSDLCSFANPDSACMFMAHRLWHDLTAPLPMIREWKDVLVHFVFPMLPGLMWYIFGRDPWIPEGPVTAWYAPPRHDTGEVFTPVEAGRLYLEGSGGDAIIATLVRLMQKKIVHYESKDAVYSLILNQDRLETLVDEEQFFLSLLFIKTSRIDLAEMDWQGIEKKYSDFIMKKLITKKYYPQNPTVVGVGFAILWYGIGAIFEIPLFYITGLYGFFMGYRSRAGKRKYVVLHSFRRFLLSQKHHWDFQIRQEKWDHPLLPYAIALGCTISPVESFFPIYDDLRKKDRHGETVGEFVSSFLSAFTSLRFKKE